MSQYGSAQLIIERPADDVLDGHERQCTKCKEWWPADDEFYQMNDRGTGFRTQCRGCRLDYWREYSANRRRSYRGVI